MDRMQKYADCQLQILRSHQGHKFLGYAIQSPGYRVELGSFLEALEAEGVQCNLVLKPVAHIFIPPGLGVWEKTAAVFIGSP